MRGGGGWLKIGDSPLLCHCHFWLMAIQRAARHYGVCDSLSLPRLIKGSGGIGSNRVMTPNLSVCVHRNFSIADAAVAGHLEGGGGRYLCRRHVPRSSY